jgi:cytochrome oxidase Cu insertion factor (SCO1/SenC/PrrC family)
MVRARGRHAGRLRIREFETQLMTTTPDNPDAARRRSQRQLLLLAGIFFAPLLVAFVLYYGFSGWRPSGSTNKGDLITPARPLELGVLLDPQDQPLDEDLLRGKWSLIYIGNGRCDARCREALTLVRQTRLALNDDASRVQRIFLATADCCNLEYLDAEHEGLLTARADEASDRKFLATFPTYGDAPVESAGRIYIVDPLGNLMMSYAPDAPQKALLEDLRKLLKLSHIG